MIIMSSLPRHLRAVVMALPIDPPLQFVSVDFFRRHPQSTFSTRFRSTIRHLFRRSKSGIDRLVFRSVEIPLFLYENYLEEK